ncbi:MAG: putative membrane protein [Cyclobacteriaceae bacterium]|jgi:putative membrane protein
MVNYDPKSWLHVFTHESSKAIFKRLSAALIYVALYTSMLAFVFHYFQVDYVGTTAVHSIMGIVLGFFLVFRSNGAYDRWWEGRKTWGALVNNSRNMAMKFAVMVPEDHVHRKLITDCMAAYPKTLKEHLRAGVAKEEMEKLRNDLHLDLIPHMPNAIAKKLIEITNILKKEGTIDAEQYRVLDSQLISLTDITGICERIKNTPIPYSYSIFMKKFIFLFLITLPFAFLPTYSYWTIVISMLLLYVLMSIELLAEEIEDPFGSDINDLPTDELSVKIEQNIRHIMGDLSA